VALLDALDTVAAGRTPDPAALSALDALGWTSGGRLTLTAHDLYRSPA
jgi:hypothetical protein